MPLLARGPLERLTSELRMSMQRLLRELCRELRMDYERVAGDFNLPVDYFERLAYALRLESYAHWKIVGWIEALNDLVYFLDILDQWSREQHRAEFVEQLFGECQEKFFEHAYLGDLFPLGRPAAGGLEKRLKNLCKRMAQDLTLESLWFDPSLPVKWCGQRQPGGWLIKGTLDQNFERAERAGTISIGLSGDWCEVPREVVRASQRGRSGISFRIEPGGIAAKTGRHFFPVWHRLGRNGRWRWPVCPAATAVITSQSAVTVGPTLVYRKDRLPRTVTATDQKEVTRISRAWRTIQDAWPEGHAVLALLTSRIVPLKAEGVVSFSYRHRPGLSFINCFDRTDLDLIDDLIHENSHHHLNLLLRKFVMYHGDHNQQIFYSPWRRNPRPLRGILHATFTFTMGAMLFERLSSWASGKRGVARWKQARLTPGDLKRARFRCLEEVQSVRYSLRDLHYADQHLGWLTGSGRRLVRELADAIDHVEQSMAPYEKAVLRSQFGPSLRRHAKELEQARQTYGPMRLNSV